MKRFKRSHLISRTQILCLRRSRRPRMQLKVFANGSSRSLISTRYTKRSLPSESCSPRLRQSWLRSKQNSKKKLKSLKRLSRTLIRCKMNLKSRMMKSRLYFKREMRLNLNWIEHLPWCLRSVLKRLAGSRPETSWQKTNCRCLAIWFWQLLSVSILAPLKATTEKRLCTTHGNLFYQRSVSARQLIGGLKIFWEMTRRWLIGR